MSLMNRTSIAVADEEDSDNTYLFSRADKPFLPVFLPNRVIFQSSQ